ncbi:1-acylglycerol-3-phosphate O-acyltransferase [Shewanella intestini]|uniref:1-acyl-sn-glycerol-3-phosphate acyltransferase n=1 Tax=Shewanella intestini TaxID=2017544 RepID=A0ABS5I0P5_9GAMM|nr:1-acylglycerol-3-phosphate O-acyltransferase [Shewanella sp. XMDDZSB0408]MBR9727592.1 1-acylglycerol-3-phosphate O-acyltransferase [Shewanella intestini]MRG35258.1 1-acylglycerol-3-phosphate O-acyltransferase [Shewanella sp. XMDDZSB0408]
MLLIIRSMILGLLLVLAFVFSMILCLIRPMHRDNVHVIAGLFAAAAPVLGIKVIKRQAPQAPQVSAQSEPNIYLANHQNNFDLFTHTSMVPESTVSMGKKSLAWMPFFGQIYWLSGNILIDRKNRHSAFETMAKTVKKMQDKLLSVWIFPEGTRSRGRGLLPFKVGAFHTAIAAQAPIIPVIASCQNHIKMNRWNNGVVIVEMMPPILTQGLEKTDVKDLCKQVHDTMSIRLTQLNEEAQGMMAATNKAA